MGMAGVRAVLLDLDGTVYEGGRPIPGAAEAVAWLRARSIALRLTSNTDSVTPAELVERLAGMGIAVAEEEILTPVVVAVRLFARTPGCRVLAVASASVRDRLRPHLAAGGEAPTHVLVADPSYGAGYADLDAAFRALRAGAALVATQVGRRMRRDDGEHLDTGGWVRLLEYAAEVEARVLGKPSADFLGAALASLGVTAAGALVVGDDVESDLAAARAVGARAALVRTGKAGGDHPGAAGADAAID
ncbi:MAG: TIGR01458 family HAD-type hydrolase, partial [Chloroflexi bacterium]